MTNKINSPLLTEQSDHAEEKSDGVKSRGSHIISRVLSPAVRLWLRSQVEEVYGLHFDITGKDREILHGVIPEVGISAQKVVYQGLHLSQIALTGSGIRVNLGQVLRGKPLRLLEPIPVVGELRLQESDLNASLESPLLSPVLKDFLVPFLPLDESVKKSSSFQLHHPQIKISEGSLKLTGEILLENQPLIPFVLQMGLGLASPQELCFQHPEITGFMKSSPDDFFIDLGPEVEIEELTLHTGELICRGKLRVLP